MDESPFVIEDAEPIAPAIRSELIEPLIAAISSVLSEMAGTESNVLAVYRKAGHQPLGDLAAVFGLKTVPEGALVVSAPDRTAQELARRILPAAQSELNADLVRDCMGEFANVFAGQAKALLAKSSYPLAIVMPQVVVDAKDFRPPPELDCFVVRFSCDHGELTLQLYMKF